MYMGVIKEWLLKEQHWHTTLFGTRLDLPIVAQVVPRIVLNLDNLPPL